MYLSQVRVKNFRNLKNVCVDLKRGLNVIVGENNVGKTNLLDAIRIALGAASSGPDALFLTKTDRHRASEGQYVDDPVHIVLVFEDLSTDEQADFLDALNYNELKPETSTATIQYEWVYSDAVERWTYRRWGSDRKEPEGTLSDDVLQALPVTFLAALRDAERALAPGRYSRLAKLLSNIANQQDRERIAEIGAKANKELQATDVVTQSAAGIVRILDAASRSDLMRKTTIRASAADFERITQTLRLLLLPASGAEDNDSLLDDLDSNGLGYNNLIYIAVVLAELEARKSATLPLLFVEEPEAHLHPQLQTQLANHLAETTGKVQTIVTTHSPTIAAHVEPKHLAIMHRTNSTEHRVTRIDSCGLNEVQQDQLRRVLDVTRATMLFAQGVILVEGICEVLLLPVFAKRLGIDLAATKVSIVTVAGVDFASLAHLFGEDKIGVPVAIVTDADPAVVREGELEVPERDIGPGTFMRSERARKVLDDFDGKPSVSVNLSDLTLEFDLSAAHPDNALAIFDAWASLYKTNPRVLSREQLVACTDARERGLLLWRALCRRSPQHDKAQVAQRLARQLERTGVDRIESFTVPAYLERAIRHAARAPGR